MNCIECKQNNVPNLNLKTKEMNDNEGIVIHVMYTHQLHLITAHLLEDVGRHKEKGLVLISFLQHSYVVPLSPMIRQ